MSYSVEDVEGKSLIYSYLTCMQEKIEECEFLTPSRKSSKNTFINNKKKTEVTDLAILTVV